MNRGRQFPEVEHGPIYHGTYEELNAGDIVRPANHPKTKFTGDAYGGGDMAWATEDSEEASSFGPNVYEVAHIEHPSTTTSYPDELLQQLSDEEKTKVVGSRHYSSKKGFRVVKRHG